MFKVCTPVTYTSKAVAVAASAVVLGKLPPCRVVRIDIIGGRPP